MDLPPIPGIGAEALISVSIRQKRSASYDPFYDDWPILYVHWQFACACGNRERSCGDAYVVEMYVSFDVFCLFNCQMQSPDGSCHLLICFTLSESRSGPRATMPAAGEREGKIREKPLCGQQEM
jgi:hypothetical protein